MSVCTCCFPLTTYWWWPWPLQDYACHLIIAFVCCMLVSFRPFYSVTKTQQTSDKRSTAAWPMPQQEAPRDGRSCACDGGSGRGKGTGNTGPHRWWMSLLWWRCCGGAGVVFKGLTLYGAVRYLSIKYNGISQKYSCLYFSAMKLCYTSFHFHTFKVTHFILL